MKKIYTLTALFLALMILLASCGDKAAAVTAGVYSLNGDKAKQSITVESGETLRFTGFNSDMFTNMFNTPKPGTEDYDEEEYDLLTRSASGAAVKYSTAVENGQTLIKAKISDFIELNLYYDKKTEIITFIGESYQLS